MTGTQRDNQHYIVRLYDGFDNEWMDVSGPLPYEDAQKLCGDKNASRRGSASGKREGSYNDIDYYAVFPADTVMMNSEEGRKQRDGSTVKNS